MFYYVIKNDWGMYYAKSRNKFTKTYTNDITKAAHYSNIINAKKMSDKIGGSAKVIKVNSLTLKTEEV